MPNQQIGWISLYRSLQYNDLWNCERFTKGQAWVDLLLLANIKTKKIFLRGIEITVERGQLAWSIVSLSERWQWNERTVSNFLKSLNRREMIHSKTSNVSTVITICKYDEYQKSTEQSKEQSTEQTQSKVQTDNKNNKNNKENKEIVKEKLTSKNSKTACTEEEIKDIAKKLQVSVVSVERTHNIILNKIATGEFKNKTVYLSLENWVIMGIERGNIQRINPINMLGANYKLQNKVI